MRDANIYNKTRLLPRMSWSPQNLYILWNQSFKQPKRDNTSFEQTANTLFQQRWKAKRLVRAYHGDFIGERLFKRWYLPENLPDVRTKRSDRAGSATQDQTITVGKGASMPPITKSAAQTAALQSFSLRRQSVKAEQKAKEEDERLALSPVGSMMFAEVERRLDVLVFRACFAPSVYQARQMVVHGKVKLNGVKESNPNIRLNPGDMFTVDPSAISFFRERPRQQLTTPATPTESEATEDKESSTNEPSPTEGESSSLSSSVSEDAQTKSDAKQDPSTHKSWYREEMTPFTLPPYASPFIFIPAYLEPSFLTCSAVYVRHPTARPNYSEIPTPYDADGEIVRLAWEWYAKMRPRMRGKRQAATGEKGRKRW